MTDLAAIAYSSTATRSMHDRDLEALLLDARENNREFGLSGALLYDDGRFFQYIEGPADGLSSAYERIRNSRAHRDIAEYSYEAVERRYFGKWDMGFSKPKDSVILRLSQANWRCSLSDQARNSETPAGLELLLKFWSDSQ